MMRQKLNEPWNVSGVGLLTGSKKRPRAAPLRAHRRGAERDEQHGNRDSIQPAAPLHPRIVCAD